MISAVFVKLFVLMLIVLRTYVCCVIVLPIGENGGRVGNTGILQCTHEFLLSLQAAGDTVVVDHLVYGELVCAHESEKTGRSKTERKRGRRGVRRRLRRICFQPPLNDLLRFYPTLALFHPTVQTLISKKFLTNFRNSCLLCFTET